MDHLTLSLKFALNFLAVTRLLYYIVNGYFNVVSMQRKYNLIIKSILPWEKVADVLSSGNTDIYLSIVFVFLYLDQLLLNQQQIARGFQKLQYCH